MVANGGFESGTSPWTQSQTGVITSRAGQSRHGGTTFAWLNGVGSTHTDTLSQSVTIPSGCSSATLTFWLHIDTAETTSSTAYDKLTAKIGSTTLATYSNLDKNTGYAQKSFDVSAFAGQTVTVAFTGTEDSSLQTSFVVDDVALDTSGRHHPARGLHAHPGRPLVHRQPQQQHQRHRLDRPRERDLHQRLRHPAQRGVPEAVGQLPRHLLRDADHGQQRHRRHGGRPLGRLHGPEDRPCRRR